jgi:hypothetical protein
VVNIKGFEIKLIEIITNNNLESFKLPLKRELINKNT